jgi:uncharacterized BrkB/YihY/UPF0761 family membrane protein
MSTGEGPTAREGIIARLRAGATSGAARATSSLDGWRGRSPAVDAMATIVERDRASFGTVVGSAIALRLFVFFLPTVLFLVGVLAIAGRSLDPDTINEAAGLTSTVADQIAAAMNQGGTAGWVALLFGAFGMATSGRTLARVLIAASSLAWNVPISRARTMRVLGTLLVVVMTLTLCSIVVNRIRLATGVAVGGLVVALVAVVYLVLWMVLMSALPSATNDPGSTLPGAVMVSTSLALLQAVTQLFLSTRLASASQLYGAIGVAAVIIGWLFLLGRLTMLGLVVNAVIYERFGSLSQVVFGLPVVRVLPRKVPAVRRFFDLDGEPANSAEVID